MRRATRGGGQHVCAWCSGSGAGAPTTGERFVRELPSLTAEMCPLGLEACAQASPERLNLVRLDHRGAHTAHRRHWLAHVPAVWRPPEGPELHPREHVWRALTDVRAWRHCPPLAAPPEAVGPFLRASETSTRPSLTSDADLVEAIKARTSSQCHIIPSGGLHEFCRGIAGQGAGT
jgi:hypothetical protein